MFLILLIGCGVKEDKTKMDLSGEWGFLMDPRDIGIEEKWYADKLPETVQLPGSMAMNGKGIPVGYDTKFIANNWIVRHNPDYKWYEDENYKPYLSEEEFLYPFWLIADKYYTGMAWYQREIEIPENWHGKNIELFLERCHLETRAWLNEHSLGKQNSLGTAHRYDLTGLAEPGKHTLTIAVDNRVKEIDVGLDSHSVSDNTQTSWNGIVGEIKLVRREPVSISGVRVFPDVANRMATIEIEIENITGVEQQAVLKIHATGKDSDSPHRVGAIASEIDARDRFTTAVVQYHMGEDMRAWDEFSPHLYELTVELTTSRYRESKSVNFGMRNFGTDGTRFAINGRPLFLRGTLESAIFPKTGFPPTDVGSWERILKICRAHGLNHLRFHSWCPPKAAFEAADKMGFYFQVEASSWAHVGYGNPIDQWLYDETERMMQAYGNHPSFVMMTHGNEPHGQYREAYLAEYLDHWKARDGRRLYTAGAGWPMIPESDYHNSSRNARIQGWGQQLNSIVNRQPPTTDYDWSSAVESSDKPLVSHEIGQWCVYPNFNEMAKYDGLMQPTNFRIFKRSLEANHMLHLADRFLMASGKLQALLYKADIEAALRTPGLAGFQLLDLQDFSGQGTALVGVLDAFWEEKGYISPEAFRRFCNTTVPLARLDKRIFTEGDTLHALIEVAHFGEAPLHNVTPRWRLIQDKKTIADGFFGQQDIAIGNGTLIGIVDHPLQKEYTARKLTLEVAVETFENSWDVWVFPENQPLEKKDIAVVEYIDEDIGGFLEGGGKVLLSLGKGKVAQDMGGDVGVGFSSIFWNTAWTNNQKPHTLGILCDPEHPALELFPTEYHSNWQWWDAMSHADALRLDTFSPELKPIVRIVDDWVTNRRLALIFEAKVGEGSILVSGVDLVNNLEDRPEARQLRSSLLHYMGQDLFNPRVELSQTDLLKMLE